MTVTHLPTHAVETPPGSLTAMQLIDRAHITYRQLDYWARTGLLEPTIRPATGSGTQRLYYSLCELHKAVTLAWLLDAGLSLQTCRHIIDGLMTTGSAHLTNGLVIHLPEDL